MKVFKPKPAPIAPEPKQLNLFEAATILFRIDSGENPTIVCRDYGVNPSKVKDLRLMKLSYAPLAEAYREAVKSYRDQWVTDAADFMKAALKKATRLLDDCVEARDLNNVISAIDTVGKVLSDQKIVNATSYSLLQTSIAEANTGETVDTEFTEVLGNNDTPINRELLEKYDLVHLADDFGAE